MQSLCIKHFNNSWRKELKINGISAIIKWLLYFGGTVATIVNVTFPKGHKINLTFFQERKHHENYEYQRDKLSNGRQMLSTLKFRYNSCTMTCLTAPNDWISSDWTLFNLTKALYKPWSLPMWYWKIGRNCANPQLMKTDILTASSGVWKFTSAEDSEHILQ